jgi:hypothetical protein
MNKTNNPILNATLSKLFAERDEALAQFDLIVNKNMSDTGVSGIVDQAVRVSKKISETEMAIEWISGVIQDNDNSAKSIEAVKELQDAITSKIKENENNNNNDGNNP